MKGYPITKVIKEMAEFEGQGFTGNIVPHSWTKTIARNGKPNSTAILLLADIVYWYRPYEKRDESTGDFVAYQKKFKADKLQRSYGAFAKQYGFTKTQVRNALQFLKSLGVIDLEFRSFEVSPGMLVGNALFIGLNVQVLHRLTYVKTIETFELEDVSEPVAEYEPAEPELER